MEKKRYMLFLVGALAVALFAFAGCDDDDDDPVAVATTADLVAVFGVGGGGPMKAEGDPCQAIISVSGVDVLPTCEVNGVELGMEPEFMAYSGALGYFGYFELGAENAVSMTVDLGGDDGDCEFDGVIPGTAEIVGTSTIDVTYGDPCTADWTASANADAYWYYGYMSMRYYDTGGTSHYTSGNIQGMTTETELMINIAEELGDAVVDFDYVDYISGYFYVQPIAGPLNPGDASNLTGPCTGFALLLGEEMRWSLDEALPPPAELESELRNEALKKLIGSLR